MGHPGEVPAPPTRRRGAELENAVLDAAWDELSAHGWAGFSIGGVARRCGTAKPVIYRRWANRVELVQAVMARAVLAEENVVPSSGDLAEDLHTFLRTMAEFLRGPFGEVVRGSLSEPSPQAGGALASSDVPAALAFVVQAAVDRGDLSACPSALVQNIGPALVVHELTHTGSPPSDELLRRVVDEAWLPAFPISR
jgi:AcrR family transcriptional regulator